MKLQAMSRKSSSKYMFWAQTFWDKEEKVTYEAMWKGKSRSFSTFGRKTPAETEKRWAGSPSNSNVSSARWAGSPSNSVAGAAHIYKAYQKDIQKRFGIPKTYLP